jgi:hypothetical protein
MLNHSVPFSLHAKAQAIERQIYNRRCIEREQLAHDQASHNRDAERPPELISGPSAERQRQSAK